MTTQALALPADAADIASRSLGSLSELRPGQAAEVLGVEAPIDIHQRLQEMGLVRGTAVRVQKYAPLGDPMELVIGSYHLSLRHSEARCVRVVLTR